MKLLTNLQRRATAMLMFSVFFISAQAQVWNRTYIEDRPVLLFSSILKGNNSYYVTGVTVDKGGFTNFDRAFIGKLDDNGNVAYYKTITDSAGKTYSAYFNTLIKDNHGKLVFAGYSIDSFSKLLLVKTDEDLSNVQVYEYTTPNTSAFQGRAMLQHTDGYYYVTGVRTVQSTNNASVVLLKIDSDGNRLWEKLYNEDKIDYAESIIGLANGNLMLGAYRTNINQTNEIANTWLIEVDTGGGIQRQWFDSSDSTYVVRSVSQTSDNQLIYIAQKKISQSGNTVACIATITKMDTGFSKQWVYNGGYRSIYTALTDIELLPDGSFIACGQKPFYYQDSTILSGWVLKLSSTGQIIWDKVYTGINQPSVLNFLTDIDILPDGSLIAVGQCQRNGHSPPQVGWFLKLDSNGCEIENCTVGIEPGAQNEEPGQIQVYPNPAQNSLTIQYDNLHHNSALFITNLLGETIETIPVNNSSGKLQVNTTSYQNGVYLARIEAGNRVLLKDKFVILK